MGMLPLLHVYEIQQVSEQRRAVIYGCDSLGARNSNVADIRDYKKRPSDRDRQLDSGGCGTAVPPGN